MGHIAGSRLLLDSHTVLWWEHDLERLSRLQCEALEEETNEVYVSAATAWELGIKRAKGKLQFAGSMREMLARRRFLELPVSIAHAEKAAELPKHHTDPFDRLLIAQAMLEGMILLTVDSQMSKYGVPLTG